jgi:hypothetical protein
VRRQRRSLEIREPAVAATDALVALESVWLGLRLARDRTAPDVLRTPFLVFFGATAAASGLGAALHGLTDNGPDPRRSALWRASLASIGVAALSSWALALRLARPGSHAPDERVVGLVHAPYFLIVATGDRPFKLAIACYVPAAVGLALALGGRLGDADDRRAATVGLAGLCVTFAAAGVQVRRIGLGRAFDHNALYHTLQAGGIALLYRSATGFLARSSPDEPRRVTPAPLRR